ncbi:RDD family protein [Pseudoxanthomonas daejeonensis]|uniref:RDD family protein n=1 Tax=Pseudoxanthomonas daejeonensis TaxID=266062 RepID=UPI001F53E572|nr:RDD family protein [Pseudoxanthomonas daejeonensis]UNK58496.1 RDD family protein [Pseudoxanthomonas daejeonensis]
MTEWYYADRQRRQIGPQPAEALVQRFRAGEIDAATLVWRDGLPAWQPLGSLRAELGLEDAAATLDFRIEPVLAASAPPADATPAAAPGGGGVAPASAGAYSPYSAPVAMMDVRAGADPVHGGDVVMAGLWRRFAASVVDGLVTGVLSYALLIPLMLVFGMSLSSLAQNELAGAGASVTFLFLNYAISFGVPMLYFAWMHSSGTQASLGKMAVGAKVVRTNGEPIGFGRALLRYLAYLLFVLFTCGLGVLISGLMVAFTERKQALHDMLCDTLVVDKWAYTDRPEWQERGLGTVTVVILVLFALMFVAMAVAAIAMIGLLSSMKW